MHFGQPIREITAATPAHLTHALLAGSEPVVLRGLVNDWPVTQCNSDSELAQYLLQFALPVPLYAMVAAPEQRGRYFYNADMTGFNFTRQRMPLAEVLKQILAADGTGYYVGSTAIDAALPGFRSANALTVLQDKPLYSLWLSNHSRVAAHYDVTDNIACVVHGERKFTLFPAEQIDNLYIGPLEFTPAGQSCSLVDFHQPDLNQFPKFAQAMDSALTATLSAGDAIFIPSMWWHHIEATGNMNLMVNYWWRQAPEFAAAPQDALMLALASIKDLPQAQRDQWAYIFDHYVFNPTEHDYIEKEKRGAIGPLDDITARQIKAQLLQKLNR